MRVILWIKVKIPLGEALSEIAVSHTDVSVDEVSAFGRQSLCSVFKLMHNIYVFVRGGIEEDTLPAVWGVRRNKQRGGVRRQLEKNIFHPVTNRERRKTLCGRTRISWTCFGSLKLSETERIGQEWWASRVHKDVMLDCTGEVQTSGPQGSLGCCFAGLLIRTKMYFQSEE